MRIYCIKNIGCLKKGDADGKNAQNETSYIITVDENETGYFT